MGAKAAISVEQYLQTSFPDLDREYREGELVERESPDYLHGKTQGILAALFIVMKTRVALFPCVLYSCIATRMRLRPGLILIPDVAVFYPTEPERVPSTPPFIAIEVLSMDDRLSAVREKLEEYKSWGVPHVWLVDPHGKRLYACDAGLNEVSTLVVPELEIEITPREIFG